MNFLWYFNILYNINEDINNVEGIEISKKKLRFNILFFDDQFINQFVYHDTNNKSKINIKMIQDTYLNSLITENNILYVNKL